MNGSPIDEFLAALDNLDVDAASALLAPQARLLTADGRRAEGADNVRQLLSAFLAMLRSTKHHITAQWHQDDAWIAEVDATYELQDWLLVEALPRAIVVRDGPDGITDIHIYGAHERRLSEHRTGEDGMWVRDRWIPPL